MEPYIYLIIWLAFLASGVIGWFFYNKMKLEEKKLLIQQGIHPDEKLSERRKWQFPWLKLGIIIISLGMGLLIIAIMANLHLTGNSDAFYPAIFCLCGGIGLVIAHIVPTQRKGDQ